RDPQGGTRLVVRQGDQGEVVELGTVEDGSLPAALVLSPPAIHSHRDERGQLAGGDETVAVPRGRVVVGPAAQAFLEVITEDRSPQFLIVARDLSRCGRAEDQEAVVTVD